MKAAATWSQKHYLPYHLKSRAKSPYICRIAPYTIGFEFEIYDPSPSTVYTLKYRKRDSDESLCVSFSGTSYRLEGLDTNTDYVFSVKREDGITSTERLVRTGETPGTTVNYLHPDDTEYDFSGRYLCSPSLLRLDDGTLLASMDLYESGAPQNLTLIYSSKDNGKTWKHLCELFPCFWGKMFYCARKLYMLGCSTEYGDLLIGSSDDGGRTWGKPTVLLRGGCHCKEVGWHRAPMPVLVKNGRIMTDVQYGAWSKRVFCDAVISAPANSNLLNAQNWVCTELFDAREHLFPLPEKIWGGIEGNVLSSSDGKIVDFLRFANKSALILNYDPDNPEQELTFNQIIDFPCTASKFNIVFDEVSKKYITIASRALDEPKTVRNLLSIFSSEDLINWRLCTDLIDKRTDDPKMAGFQYVDFLIDGNDILYLCRTAYNSPNNFHNSNYTTFHKIEKFRDII